MKLERATVEFEVDGKTIEMDVLAAQLQIEKYQTECEGDINVLIANVKQYFTDAGAGPLTDTQAWCAIQGIECAYEAVKKKLLSTLESDFGTTPILLTNPPGFSSGSTVSSPTSSQNGNSSNDKQTPPSQEIDSESLSELPPVTR
jgi:hypothetical protein